MSAKPSESVAMDDGEPYQGNLFPSSYLVVYCPYDSCTLEEPFKDAEKLAGHLVEYHKTTIHNVNAVLPIFDRYLKALKAEGFFSDDSELLAIGSDGRDDDIRDALQKEKLQEVLDIQEKERQGLYLKPRQCLFCLEFAPSHRQLFSHMFAEHGFNIGLLDNLVMVDDFLKTLEGILAKNVCIHCHNVFRSSGCLRKHMKNKRHHRIDSKNHFYDKYYIVNYIKCGVLGNGSDAAVVGEKEEEEEEDDWDDLVGDADLRTTCLFCELVFESPADSALTEHLKDHHKFDLEAVRSEFSNENFYDYIKLITYIRHQTNDLICPACESVFDTQDGLEKHMAEMGHCVVPERKLWDQPQYFFPVFDDDPLLFEFGESVEPTAVPDLDS